MPTKADGSRTSTTSEADSLRPSNPVTDWEPHERLNEYTSTAKDTAVSIETEFGVRTPMETEESIEEHPAWSGIDWSAADAEEQARRQEREWVENEATDLRDGFDYNGSTKQSYSDLQAGAEADQHSALRRYRKARKEAGVKQGQPLTPGDDGEHDEHHSDFQQAQAYALRAAIVKKYRADSGEDVGENTAEEKVNGKRKTLERRLTQEKKRLEKSATEENAAAVSSVETDLLILESQQTVDGVPRSPSSEAYQRLGEAARRNFVASGNASSHHSMEQATKNYEKMSNHYRSLDNEAKQHYLRAQGLIEHRDYFNAVPAQKPQLKPDDYPHLVRQLKADGKKVTNDNLIDLVREGMTNEDILEVRDGDRILQIAKHFGERHQKGALTQQMQLVKYLAKERGLDK